jgi:hypothetical protein
VDSIAGLASGTLSTFVRHPIDTVKVRIQISSKATVSVSKAFKEIFISEGVRGFFRGIISMIVIRGPLISVSMTAYGFGKR